eukprot:scaffold26688_cov101-Isochrysis_galbana.AAC.2
MVEDGKAPGLSRGERLHRSLGCSGCAYVHRSPVASLTWSPAQRRSIVRSLSACLTARSTTRRDRFAPSNSSSSAENSPADRHTRSSTRHASGGGGPRRGTGGQSCTACSTSILPMPTDSSARTPAVPPVARRPSACSSRLGGRCESRCSAVR